MIKDNEEAHDLIMNNYEEAEFITRNFDRVTNRIRLEFKLDLAARLESELPTLVQKLGLQNEGFKVTNINDVTNKMAPLWIEGENNPHLCFGIEPFNPNSNAHLEGSMFIGVFPRHFSDKEYDFQFPGDSDKAPYWLATESLRFNEEEINLRDKKYVDLISNLDSDDYKKFRDSLIEGTISYMERVLENVEDHEFFLRDLKAVS